MGFDVDEGLFGETFNLGQQAFDFVVERVFFLLDLVHCFGKRVGVRCAAFNRMEHFRRVLLEDLVRFLVMEKALQDFSILFLNGSVRFDLQHMLDEFLGLFDFLAKFLANLLKFVSCLFKSLRRRRIGFQLPPTANRTLEQDRLFQLMDGDLGRELGQRHMLLCDFVDFGFDSIELQHDCRCNRYIRHDEEANKAPYLVPHLEMGKLRKNLLHHPSKLHISHTVYALNTCGNGLSPAQVV